ncbi:hypothetical protein COY17_04385 [Candidatus Saccharibacteria bacterium CG_4_10_14_0_2_um_filter_52_9]|nr:MAG: hypothetical protein COY17_04385 [Candidatus Saccharibacteria bacterium CG_4_10_14_0_2_um_filter_52_9]
MARRLLKHQGFAVIESLLISLIVVAICGTGYYVYSTNKAATKTLATPKTIDAEPLSQTRTIAGQKYLIINKYKIKFPLPADISDAYYVSINGSVGFGVKSLGETCQATKKNATYGSDGTASVGIAELGFELNASKGSTYGTHATGSNESKVDDNYFSISANVGCESSDPNTEIKIQAVQKSFEAAGSNITAE